MSHQNGSATGYGPVIEASDPQRQSYAYSQERRPRMFEPNSLIGGDNTGNGPTDSNTALPSGGEVPAFLVNGQNQSSGPHLAGGQGSNNAGGGSSGSQNRMQVLNHRLKNRGGKFSRVLDHLAHSRASTLIS